MIKRTVTATLALALLAACQKGEEPLAIDEGNNIADTDVETLPPSEDGGNATDTTNSTATTDKNAIPTIPAQYHGRWGMNANDCDPKKADIAKGLIEIDPLTLRFYEATATLAGQRPAIATSYSANFNFVGEGMKWDKVETLTITGDTLKREDKDGSFTYKRCA
ncbi:hypothetical protein [Sphingomonas jaspsi]|uniref:hypothetical protein n=1 Tax=Sphingomonas jaspsi TaxID=392409 RepID=UPI0004AD0E6C|nr:hypothetical protein [Sphingomonas jaspsi]